MELAQADMILSAGGTPAIDIGPIITKVADGFRGDGLDVVADMPDSVPRVVIDPSGLEAIATTLLENSKQAGATRIGVTATPGEDGLTLSFEDNGSGIAEADRARIFEPFFTSKREAGGTGMGLSIARSLAEAHGAALELVESEQGARFNLCLRRAQ
jgi:signal transduction histidine kinase